MNELFAIALPLCLGFALMGSYIILLALTGSCAAADIAIERAQRGGRTLAINRSSVAATMRQSPSHSRGKRTTTSAAPIRRS